MTVNDDILGWYVDVFGTVTVRETDFAPMVVDPLLVVQVMETVPLFSFGI